MLYTAQPSQTPSPDGTPVYDFFTTYLDKDANGKDVEMLQLEGCNSVQEINDRIADCNDRLAAIALLG